MAKNIIIINILILFVFLTSFKTYSQVYNPTDIIEITGRIVNQSNGHPVRFAQIVNLHRGTGVMSDSLGFFHFTLINTDFLRISSMGYYPQVISFADSLVDKMNIYNIALNERSYYLPEIDIFAQRWNEFKFDFARIPITVDKSKENVQQYILSLVDKEELAMIVASKSVGFELPLSSNRQKQLKKIAELEQKDAFDRIADERYNKTLVSKLTGLNGEELDNFIAYCDIDKAYILRSNDYDIILKINKMYDIYKKTKLNEVNFN
jgi:hypothetical protein